MVESVATMVFLEMLCILFTLAQPLHFAAQRPAKQEVDIFAPPSESDCSRNVCEYIQCEEIDRENCGGVIIPGGFCNCCEVCIFNVQDEGSLCSETCEDGSSCDPATGLCRNAPDLSPSTSTTRTPTSEYCPHEICSIIRCDTVVVLPCEGRMIRAGFCGCCEICDVLHGRQGDPCSLGCMEGLICDGESNQCIYQSILKMK